LVAAINLANRGKNVCLIERQSRGGKKILASGNGHCNISNLNISTKYYKGANKELLKRLINNCSSQKIIDFFNNLGLEIVAKDDGKMYPKSMQASSVLNLLESRVEALNIDRFYSINNLKVQKGFKIFANDYKIEAKNIVIATGSLAAPQLGGTSFGLELAKSFGHNIIKPLPALVPLTSKDSICKALNGVKLDVKVTLFVQNKERTSVQGDILFRDYGVSGLSILDISIEATKEIDLKKDVTVVVDFFKELNKKELLEYLKSRINKSRALSIELWLSGFLHTKLAKFITKKLNLKQIREDRLNKKILKELVEFLKNYPIKIDGFRDYKYAEVAIGGVDSREIGLNFESKKQKGLFFCGEVIDITGARGGYNFHFAWCSGLSIR